MSVPDLSVPYRDAIIAASAITGALPAYLGSYPVFTRVPVPDDASPVLLRGPIIVVSAQVQAGEEDGVDSQRPVIDRDIMVYGLALPNKNDPDDQFRATESVAFAVHALFHRQRRAITVSGWSVTDLTATGPAPAPTDDEQTVGRRVTVRARLDKKN